MLWATGGPSISATALAYCQRAACHGEQADFDNKMKLWAARVVLLRPMASGCTTASTGLPRYQDRKLTVAHRGQSDQVSGLPIKSESACSPCQFNHSRRRGGEIAVNVAHEHDAVLHGGEALG